MCEKKTFETKKLANKRCKEINKEIRIKKNQKHLLRVYRCEICNKYHLTKMSVHKYKFKTDVSYRNKLHEEKFIEKESNYWNLKFGIEI